jgi:uncharacterized protein with von Willebrand factor type A (vWA) domain
MGGTPSGSPRWPLSSPGGAEAAAGAAPSGALAWTRPGDLAGNVTLFGRRLRRRGLLVGPSEISDALRALAEVDLTDREIVRLTLRTILCCRSEDLPVFDDEFARFWLGPALRAGSSPQEDAPEGPPPGLGEAGDERQRELAVSEWSDSRDAAEERQVPAYSPTAARARKDFSTFTADELQAITELILVIARLIATRLSRRTRGARRGSVIDLRHTMRRNLRYGGEVLDLVWRRRKIRKAKLVLLCDVSGSMDIYSRFLVQFIYALQGVISRVESFLFSTSLTRVTDALGHRDIREALREASRRVPDWSGGTKIGASLKHFNEGYARRLVDARTIVVICSDGWDTGDLEVLEQAMRELRARAGRVIWLNPLLGSPGYEPVTQGMSTALPFVDVFASAHNLDGLRELERYLATPRAGSGAPRRGPGRLRPSQGPGQGDRS